MYLNPLFWHCQSHLPMLFIIVPFDFQFHYVGVSETNLFFPIISMSSVLFSKQYIQYNKSSSKNLVSMLESAYLENLATSHSSDCISCRLAHKKKGGFYPPHFPQNTMVWTPILLTRVSWSSECNIKPAALTPCSCCHGDNGRIHSLLFAMLVIRLF